MRRHADGHGPHGRQTAVDLKPYSSIDIYHNMEEQPMLSRPLVCSEMNMITCMEPCTSESLYINKMKIVNSTHPPSPQPAHIEIYAGLSTKILSEHIAEI